MGYKCKTMLIGFIMLLLFLITPVAAADMPFADMPDGAWYKQNVVYCYENNLMKGTSDTAFQPDLEMSRAMLVTVLHRIAGEPASTGNYPFTDIESGSWYEDAVAWAYENNVVNGTSVTTFSPGDDISREAMVTIFYRYAKSMGQDVSASSALTDYSDRHKVSDWADSAMRWAVADGIINGKGYLGLDPQGNTTRAECATVIRRFIQWADIQLNVPEEPDNENSDTPPVVAPEEPDSPTLPHEHSYTAGTVVKPTCTTTGYTVYQCDCGVSYHGDEVPAIRHDYTETPVPPTCTENGYTSYSCTVCGDSYAGGDLVPAVGHNYEKAETEATCTEPGSRVWTCSECGDSFDGGVIPALGHTHELLSVTQPTKIIGGYITYKCIRCDDSLSISEFDTLFNGGEYSGCDTSLVPPVATQTYAKDGEKAYIWCTRAVSDIGREYEIALARDPDFTIGVLRGSRYVSGESTDDICFYSDSFIDFQQNRDYAYNITGTYYYKLRTVEFRNGQYAYGLWSEPAVLSCPDFQNKSVQQEAQYSYEVYFVDNLGADLYTETNRVVYIKTDNPNPDTIRFTLDDENITYKPEDYADVVYLDDANSNTILRKVPGGYLCRLYLKAADPESESSLPWETAGNYQVELREADTDGYVVAKKMSFNVLILQDEYDKWYASVISSQTDSSMNPKEKMDAIVAFLNNGQFKYYVNDENGYLTLAASPNSPDLLAKRWDSYVSPSRLYRLAEIIGEFEEIHNCFFDYPRGTEEWYEWHHQIYVVYEGVRYNYSVCPSSHTGFLDEIPMIDFANTDQFMRIS